MGLPQPLGPYGVSFADFELRRTEELQPSQSGGGGAAAAEPQQKQQHHHHLETNGIQQNGGQALPQDLEETPATATVAVAAPLMRIFYPTEAKTRWSGLDAKQRCWVPNYNYMWGFVARAIPPTSFFVKICISFIALIMYSLMWFRLQIKASVRKPLLVPKGEGDKQRLPVVIFSHGMWACRTTYSSTCIDVASHGYIVVAVEHLDGSAVMAQYHDHRGKRKWVDHAFADKPFDDTPMAERTKQLRQRVQEIQKVIDVLERLDQGSLTQDFNNVTGRVSLDTKFFQQRLDLNHIAIHGHSFGAATAIVASGVEKRIKCCVGEDVWWSPVEEVDYSRLAGKSPVLLLNTEGFDWASLRDCRNKFLEGRAKADNVDTPLVTVLMTIKGTEHMDQSDFPLLFPTIAKRARMTGVLDPTQTKDINSRACLDFLYRNLLPPGTGAPYVVNSVKEDGEHLVIAKAAS
ncbi:hypothetical protein CY35_02G027700 [Sphagnum magellanicum]|nr:hypothetical protein CY35_02G027700 [Sphagnum magellanicum]